MHPARATLNQRRELRARVAWSLSHSAELRRWHALGGRHAAIALLAVAATHLKRLGTGLNSAVSNYNSFIGSFETRVLSTGRKFRDLDIETGGKEIEPVEPLDVLARDAQADDARARPAAE